MGLPLAFKSLALFYNKNVISSAPETTDGIIRLSQLLPDDVYPLLYQADSFYFHAPWFFGSGARLFEGEPAGGLISEKAKSSYELVYRWRSDGILPSEISASLVTNLFNENRSALVVNGPWFLGEIAEGVPFGVAPLPIVSATGERATPFLTAEGIFILPLARPRASDGARDLPRWARECGDSGRSWTPVCGSPWCLGREREFEKRPNPWCVSRAGREYDSYEQLSRNAEYLGADDCRTEEDSYGEELLLRMPLKQLSDVMRLLHVSLQRKPVQLPISYWLGYYSQPVSLSDFAGFAM